MQTIAEAVITMIHSKNVYKTLLAAALNTVVYTINQIKMEKLMNYGSTKNHI